MMKNRRIFAVAGTAVALLSGAYFYYRVVTSDGWERQLILQLAQYFEFALIPFLCIVIGGAVLDAGFKKFIPNFYAGNVENFFKVWTVAMSLAFGVFLFVHFLSTVLQNNTEKSWKLILTMVIVILATVVPKIYSAWDKFVDRHA